jgi:hypothetical protein
MELHSRYVHNFIQDTFTTLGGGTVEEFRFLLCPSMMGRHMTLQCLFESVCLSACVSVSSCLIRVIMARIIMIIRVTS